MGIVRLFAFTLMLSQAIGCGIDWNAYQSAAGDGSGGNMDGGVPDMTVPVIVPDMTVPVVVRDMTVVMMRDMSVVMVPDMTVVIVPDMTVPDMTMSEMMVPVMCVFDDKNSTFDNCVFW